VRALSLPANIIVHQCDHPTDHYHVLDGIAQLSHAGQGQQMLVKDRGEWKIVAYHNVDVKPGVRVPEPQ
jgi:hypothetical protein